MKKALLLFLIILIPIATSIPQLEIVKKDLGSTIVSELNNPAKFEFTITNKNNTDNFEIYSYLGVNLFPKGTFELPKGKKTILVEARPNSEVRKTSGFYNFEYEIRGSNSGIFKDTLKLKIVKLNEVLAISTNNISPEDLIANISIINLENTIIDDLTINFRSIFFDFDETITLYPYQKVSIETNIQNDKMKEIIAGQYIITATPIIDQPIESIEGTINYIEKGGFSVDSKTTGFIVREDTEIKKNEGNINSKAKIEKRQDIISRLFTTHSIQPINVQRSGLFVTYSWERDLAPTEELEIKTTTNYTFPFILVILIIIIGFLIFQNSNKTISFNKRVSFLRTKGGELALKVKLNLKAIDDISQLKVTDRIPGMTKLYEGAGSKPDHIDSKTRTLHWNIQGLNSGESRIISYIIYSKIRIVGKLALPTATVTYTQNGKTFHIKSNKTFFLAETTDTE